MFPPFCTVYHYHISMATTQNASFTYTPIVVGFFDFRGVNRIPRGSGKLKQTTKSRNQSTQINRDAKVGNIVPSEDKMGYSCSCCGKRYKLQKNNFPHTMSPLFKANGGYLPICKHCIDKYYEQLVDYFSGNEEKAMERIAQIADWYYLDDIWSSTRKISADRSRVGAYPSKMQLPQWKEQGATYLDTIRDRAGNTISSLEDYDSLKEQDKISVSKAQIARWGTGFTEEEYNALDAHYKTLKDKIDVNDVIQDNLARDLCEIKIQQVRARGDADGFQKFTKLYQDTLKSANLKVKSGDAELLTDGEACWGKFIADIEQFTPADVYKDRSLFADVDGIKGYFERFIVRPFKNFFMGSDVMDKEFSIHTDGDDDGD